MRTGTDRPDSVCYCPRREANVDNPGQERGAPIQGARPRRSRVRATRVLALVAALAVVAPAPSIAARVSPQATTPTDAHVAALTGAPNGAPAGRGRPTLRPGAQERHACEHADDRLLVRFEPGEAGRDHRPLFAKAGATKVRAVRGVPGLEVVRTSLPLEAAAAAIRGGSGVRYVELDCVVSLDALPNDTSFGQQWGLRNTGQTGGASGADIDAPAAWDIRTDASAAPVGVIDTGVQYTHPDLSANMWINTAEVSGNGVDDDGNGYVDDRRGWDFVNNDNDPADDNGHGTHVAGTIGARGNNGIGVAGVAWVARLMPLKAFNAAGQAFTSDIVEALAYAADMGARVTNNSYSTPEFSRTMYDAFVASGSAGVLAIAAAGNVSQNSDELPRYPSAFRLASLISVAATTHDDALAGFSNFGIHNVHVAAPGDSILSTVPGSGYGSNSGTSMATPHVAGVAALLRAANPAWTATQVRDRILGTTRAVAGLVGSAWTGGVVDAAAALGAGPTVLPPASPAFTPEALGTALVADPNPAPAAAPAPPTFPTPEVLENSPADPGPPAIAVNAAGHAYIAFTETQDGAHLWSNATGSWADRRLTSSYDEYGWIDVEVNGSGVPVVALQRLWSALDEYFDPGIVELTAGQPSVTASRVTASCPDAGSCRIDWNPRMALDGSGASHVVFTRSEGTSPISDHVIAPDGPASADGAGIYYATDATGSWVVRRLTTHPQDAQATIDVEADGTAHIAFLRRDGSATGVYYVTNDGGSWTIRRLSDMPEDSGYALGVDGAGVVHVAVARFALGLYYYRRAANGTWAAPVRVFDGGAAEPDLAIEANDKVHIGFGLGEEGFGAAGVRYATNRTGAWVTSFVAGGEAHTPSIAVDGAGHAFLAYLQALGAPLGVHYATNLGGSFQSTLVRAWSSEGDASNAAYRVDADGFGHVAIGAHSGETNAGLWYGTNRAGSWTFSRIHAGWPSSVDLAVDAAGRAHVAFTEVTSLLTGAVLPPALWKLAYATNATGSWAVQTAVAGAEFSVGVGLALDAAGAPRIAYVDWEADTLRQLRRVNNAWLNDAILTDDLLRDPSIVVDGAGVSHIALSKTDAGDPGWGLLYVRGTPGTWTATDVTNGADLDLEASIARASDGTIWVANWRIDQGIWVHRRSPAGAWTAISLASGFGDSFPTIAVDAADVPHVAYLDGTYYGPAGCAVPMCATGPGIRHAWLSGGWQEERLTPYPLEGLPLIAAGLDGSVSLAFARPGEGLRRLTVVQGKPTVTLKLSAASDSGTSTSDGITNATTLTYAVTFDRDMTGVAAGDFSRTGTATGCVINAPTGSGDTYSISLTGCSQGTVTLSFAANGATDGDDATGPATLRSAPVVTIDRMAPTAVAPAASLRSGVNLASAATNAALPTALAWSATDSGGAGVATYDVGRSVAGGAFANIATGTAATTLNTTMTPGQTHRFEARAVDKAGNVGGWTLGPTLSPALVQNGSAISFSSGWTKSESASFSGGSLRYHKTQGASATYTFTGRGIAFVTTRRPAGGKVKILIDGVKVAVIDTFSTSTTYRYIAFARAWSTSGQHTIKLVVKGTAGHPRVDLDAVEVIR